MDRDPRFFLYCVKKSTAEMALSRLSSRSNSLLLHPFATAASPLTVETSVPFRSHLCEAPSRSVETSSQELLMFFHDMALIRRMEFAADLLYKAKLFREFCHLYDGQEAVAIGMEAAIMKKDAIITSYRDHCTFLGSGGGLIEALSELMGRKSLLSRSDKMWSLLKSGAPGLLGDGADLPRTLTISKSWIRSLCGWWWSKSGGVGFPPPPNVDDEDFERLFASVVIAFSTAVLSSSSALPPIPSKRKTETWEARFDGLRFIETLVTAHI